MKSAARTVLLFSIAAGIIAVAVGLAAPAEVVGRHQLADGWSLQSSARVQARGDAISGAGFSASGWYRATVPSTVCGVL